MITSSSRPKPDTLIRTIAGPSQNSTHAAAWALDCGELCRAQVSILTSIASMPQRPPQPRELFLWFGTSGAESWDSLLPHLDHAEHARAARFHHVADRWSFAAAPSGLRALLGKAMDIAPTEIGIVPGPKGKPLLDPARHGAEAARAIQFNISHSRDLVAVAIAAHAVGVDVERRRAMPDLHAVAERVFAIESCAALAQTEQEGARTAMFFRFWSLGEAFIKATGEGITQGLSTFAFTADGAPRLLRISDAWGPAAHWQFGMP